MNLYDKLTKYKEKNIYPFHMPGHKRRSDMLSLGDIIDIDITEIDGFDNLHYPEGILKDVEDRATKLYQTRESLMLVNGSTVGILASISAHCRKGDKILIARNCHKSVYNAIYINELQPLYVYPRLIKEYNINGGVSAEDIENQIVNNPDIRLVVITSPTYEGILSDIEAIVNITKKYNIPLLVDEAHGAHLGFHNGFPKNAISYGADIVIHSLHKTLPALTQTALLHINSDLALADRIKKYLSIYQTSSPSYILMASIDKCINILEDDRYKLFDEYYNNLITMRGNLSSHTNIKLLDKDIINKDAVYDYDPSKIVLSTIKSNISGTQLYNRLLKEHALQFELSTKEYALGMTSIFDKANGYGKLCDAISEIDILLKKCDKNVDIINIEKKPTVKYTPSEVDNKQTKIIPIDSSIGKVAAEYIIPYPPGIPYLVPGEIINKEIIDGLAEYNRLGLSIIGLHDKTKTTIKVITDEV